MNKKTFVHVLTKIIIDIMFYFGIVCVIAVPLLRNRIRSFCSCSNTVFICFLAMLVLSGISAVYILFNLKKMFATLVGGNPFVEKNVDCFRNMASACAVIAVIYIIKCFLMFSLATPIIVAVFFLGMLFCLTLKDIFKQAVYYKQENDWTV